MEATEALQRTVQPTLQWDRKLLEFQLVDKIAPFTVIAKCFEKNPVREVRDVCVRGLARHNIVYPEQADWYEKAILDLLGLDPEMAGALLKQYRGHYDYTKPEIYERSLAFVSSVKTRSLPPRVAARAIRFHLDGCYGDFDPIRVIYRELLVRHALEWILAECTRDAYSREEWETMEVVFWCAVHMKDAECVPVFQGLLERMGSRQRPGRVYPAGGDIFMIECHRAVVQRTIDLIRSGIPAKPHELPKEKFKRWYQG